MWVLFNVRSKMGALINVTTRMYRRDSLYGRRRLIWVTRNQREKKGSEVHLLPE